MTIQALASRIPSRCVTNEQIVDEIRAVNDNIPEPDLTRYCRQARFLLESAGAATRYMRDRANGERALDLMIEAIRETLQESGVRATDVGLILYCGVGRGFLEPANGAFLAKALGITCDSFDVAEACLSWVRALHIAESFLKNGTYRKILVVNGEFNIHELGIPESLRIRSLQQLRYTFPALTIGEATTATLLTDSPSPWKFSFCADPSMADLCTLPLTEFEDFAEPGPRLGLNGVNRLVSFGQELSERAVRRLIEFVLEIVKDRDAVDHWFPHQATESLVKKAGAKLGLGDKLDHSVFRRYGNLISASIPVAMHQSYRGGRLIRGERVVLCPASAGASFALTDFIF